MLKRLMNTIQVVKPGTIVKSKISDDKIFIRNTILYPDNTIIYSGYSINSEGVRTELLQIYPQELSDIKELVTMETLEVSSIDHDVLSSKMDNIVVSIANDINILKYETTRGFIFTDGNQDGKYTIDQLHDMVGSRYELIRTSGYGYKNNNIILPNDVMLIKYSKINDLEVPSEYIIREVKLKPFILRMYFTILYGRTHPKNFSEVESDTNLISRFIDGIKNGLLTDKAVLFNHRNIRL